VQIWEGRRAGPVQFSSRIMKSMALGPLMASSLIRTSAGPEFVMVRFTDDELPTFTVPKSMEEGKVEISVLGIDSD